MVENFDAAHATYPPSSLGNMERCPGFRNRSGEKSEASLRGDRIHKALETDALPDLAEEERGVAQMCKDFIDGVIQEHRPKRPDKDIRERQGKMVMDLKGDIKTFGTPDRILIYGDMAEMFDYKSGYRLISDAETNAQAWSYVIGAFEKYPELKRIKFTILIPNRNEIFSHEFAREDVPRMILRLNTIIRLSMQFEWSDMSKILKLKHLLNPQPELCEYCQNQTACPALAEKALLVAARLGPGLPVPNEIRIDKSNPVAIAQLLRLAPLLEAWATQVRKDALQLTLEHNIDIPGFKRLSKKTDRSVKSVLGAWKAINDKVTLEEFLKACGSISIPQLEKLFMAAAKKGQKGKAARDMEFRLRHAGVWGDQGDIFFLKEQKK